MKKALLLVGTAVILIGLILGGTLPVLAQDEPGNSETVPPPAPGKGPVPKQAPLLGKIAAVGEDSFTAEAWWGSVEVKVNEDTKYRIRGKEGSLADLQVGDKVAVFGEKIDGVPTAKLVVVPPKVRKCWRAKLHQLRRHAIPGKVVHIGENSLTLETPRGQIDIMLTNETKYRIRGEEGSLEDISEGDRVVVLGKKTDDVFTAQLVIVAPGGAKHPKGFLKKRLLRHHLRHHALHGEVVAIGAESLTLSTKRGEVNIALTEDTKYKARTDEGLQEASQEDIEVGDKLVVIGKRVDEAPTAKLVIILPPALEAEAEE
ncbi:MAG: hypothetical protein DRI26_01935 [Chloroflexi bacterium]|nr:MAG: hypothetical protein DRI26_01935 [Chloroflexota bacterium]